MACHLDLIDHDETEFAICLQFWRMNCQKLSMLFPLAMQVLAIPATCAPVERLFSTGSLIMQPYRARSGADLLSALALLKSNYRFWKICDATTCFFLYKRMKFQNQDRLCLAF